MDPLRSPLSLCHIVLLFLRMSSLLVWGYSGGADLSACPLMSPAHDPTSPRRSKTPWLNIVPGQRVYNPGDNVSVTIRSSRNFMGFMLQARTTAVSLTVDSDVAVKGRPVGRFIHIPPGAHLLECHGPGDTATHTDKSLKRVLMFVWRAPARNVGDIRFTATIVQSYFVFWIGLESIALSPRSPTSGFSTSAATIPSASGYDHISAGHLDRSTTDGLINVGSTFINSTVIGFQDHLPGGHSSTTAHFDQSHLRMSDLMLQTVRPQMSLLPAILQATKSSPAMSDIKTTQLGVATPVLHLSPTPNNMEALNPYWASGGLPSFQHPVDKTQNLDLQMQTPLAPKPHEMFGEMPFEMITNVWGDLSTGFTSQPSTIAEPQASVDARLTSPRTQDLFMRTQEPTVQSSFGKPSTTTSHSVVDCNTPLFSKESSLHPKKGLRLTQGGIKHHFPPLSPQRSETQQSQDLGEVEAPGTPSNKRKQDENGKPMAFGSSVTTAPVLVLLASLLLMIVWRVVVARCERPRREQAPER
uniref:Reelin domain-containing protein n=1 Tax=Eptatretus burgeri TaxID=7764 RepID=A0A8C4NM76_EPTBU